jgi:O-antigen ligase
VTAAGRPIALVLAAAIAVLGFKNGGYFPPMWSWLTFAFACVLLAAVILGVPPRWSPLEVGMVSALAALAGWTLLSATWSVDPTQSVREAERALVYLAVVAAILLLGDARRVRELAVAVFGAISVVVSYALLDYLFSSHPGPEGFEGFLLFRPIGYANALGILATMGALLALGLVDVDDSRLLRCLGVAALVPLAATLVLTSSRGALVTLALGFAVMLGVASQRLHLTTSSLIVMPAALLAAALSAHADLSTGTPFFRSHRAEQLGIALIVLTVAAGLSGLLLRDAYSRRATVAAVSVAAVCAVALVAFAAASGKTPGYGGPRSDYWHVAQREWRSRPLTGTGAGTFGTYWRREGTAQGAQDAHNLYLETLAELGVVGLALLFVVLIPSVIAVRSARHEPLAPALLAAYAAYLLHAGVDWDWEMPVVTVAALACGAGLLLAARVREPRPVTHRVRIGLVGLSAALLLVSCVELFANDAITL